LGARPIGAYGFLRDITSMKIMKLSEDETSHYETIATNYGTIFNTVGWLGIFGDKVQIYGIYDKGNALIGGFCTFIESLYGFNVSHNPPSTLAIGPVIKMDATNPVTVASNRKKILTSMAEFMENLPCSVISVNLNMDIADTQPFIWKKFKVVPQYTYIINLSQSADDIWKGMSNERRKNINKGIKDGLVTQKIDDKRIIKSLLQKTFSIKRKALNRNYVDKILFDFSNPDNSFAFVTFRADVAIAASFCLYDRNTAYYFFGGRDYETGHHGASSLAIWESIKHSKRLGLKQFDFEGSMIPEIERFFRGFGGDLKPYYRVNKAKWPLEVLLKLFRREHF